MAGTKRRARPRGAPVTIPLHLQRNMMLQAAGFTHDTLAERIFEMDGVKLSRQTVGAVLAGGFENDDVIRHFCEVTGADRKEMFPPRPKIGAASMNAGGATP